MLEESLQRSSPAELGIWIVVAALHVRCNAEEGGHSLVNVFGDAWEVGRTWREACLLKGVR